MRAHADDSGGPPADSRSDSNRSVQAWPNPDDGTATTLVNGTLGTRSDDSEAAENRKVGGSTPPLATERGL
jgi:hypothetical protein